MKAIYMFVLLFIGMITMCNAQYINNNETTTKTITFVNTLDESFQFNIIQLEKESLSCSINFRMEDELSSEETYQLFNEVAFFDINLAYTFKAFEFNIIVENILGANNNNFAIEPNLEKGNGSMENIVFAHEADFLLSASIVYNF